MIRDVEYDQKLGDRDDRKEVHVLLKEEALIAEIAYASVRDGEAVGEAETSVAGSKPPRAAESGVPGSSACNTRVRFRDVPKEQRDFPKLAGEAMEDAAMSVPCSKPPCAAFGGVFLTLSDVVVDESKVKSIFDTFRSQIKRLRSCIVG
jgi:hypothetical protein